MSTTTEGMEKLEAESVKALAYFVQAEKKLPAILKANKTMPDFDTDEGYKDAKERVKPLVKTCTTFENARKSAGRYHLEAKRDIDARAKDFLEPVSAVRDELKAGIKRIDDEVKRVEAAKLQVEQDKLDAEQARFDEIDDMRQAISLDDVNAAIEKLDELNLQLFIDPSEAEIKAGEMLELLTKRKLELEGLEKQRLENEKAAEQLAADQKKQADALAEQQRVIDEQAAKIKAQQNAIDKEKADIAQAAKAKQAADDATKAAEEKAAADAIKAAEQAEADMLEAVDTAKREAKTAEDKRIADEKEKAEIEAARIADEKAAAERAPDIEKLQAYIQDLNRVIIPSMSSKEGTSMLAKIDAIHEAALREMAAVVNTDKALEKAA